MQQANARRNVRLPVILSFHGDGGSAAEQASDDHFRDVAGGWALVVHGQGIGTEQASGKAHPTWNGGGSSMQSLGPHGHRIAPDGETCQQNITKGTLMASCAKQLAPGARGDPCWWSNCYDDVAYVPVHTSSRLPGRRPRAAVPLPLPLPLPHHRQVPRTTTIASEWVCAPRCCCVLHATHASWGVRSGRSEARAARKGSRPPPSGDRTLHRPPSFAPLLCWHQVRCRHPGRARGGVSSGHGQGLRSDSPACRFTRRPTCGVYTAGVAGGMRCGAAAGRRGSGAVGRRTGRASLGAARGVGVAVIWC